MRLAKVEPAPYGSLAKKFCFLSKSKEQNMSEQDPMREDYADVSLLYNQFMLPAYRSALAAVGLAPGMHVLDLGCGAGGLFPMISEAIEPGGCITGLDRLRAHLDAAKDFAEQHGVKSKLNLVEADLHQALEFPDATFDCVWCADTMFALADTAAIVKEMVRVVKPGGIVAILSGNYSRAMYMPGHRRLEWMAVAAGNVPSLDFPSFYADFSKLPMMNPYERSAYWLQDAGLHATRMSVHPVYYQQPLPAIVRECLEKFFFENVRHYSVRTAGAEVGMSEEDIQLFYELTTPGSGKFILDEPDYYCLQNALLATGIK
jgi:ubiquinone/menaquinone biosynthesis C-methylase UbiE